ncbi:hypothetical protein MCOR27_009240 [Pyricularia oryzae]|uniref:N-acetyltransferase domain-containing protein n=1 Tax=Pyricularia grisea TaxID=148305 RepID=A0ABQ8N6R0_PYRGI|nr:hypothetical protein MCOR01_005101 [Pyricularia oryzae]KAI6292184.1 hypothetical protein MCOR33_010047 [Pyricularia grisea]KAH9431862.1 hypothetical protein MCOR02_009132 [Pyricularia oryzae]KAI6256516.1 hypothetical protein MCOR19_007023 [Pyricularia oryzae]KAI6270558.1 hypothetical protein MCOR27_009240 [Pyricularia oryzae]
MAEKPEAQDAGFVTVKTWLPSLPFPRNEDREEIITERLVIRPWKLDDVPAVHAIRTQPEVMMWTSQARPDANMAETEAKVKLFTSPNDAGNFNFVICDKATGEMIGMGGNHRRESDVGWPELGYILRKEYWGRGLATEFLRGFLEAYRKLPRSQVELRVAATSIVPSLADGDMADELLIAEVEPSNARSHGVMKKVGFEYFTEVTEYDTHDPSKPVVLAVYRYLPARAIGSC